MIAVVDARAGHARELRAAIEELAAAVRREPGCLTFVLYLDLGKDGRFHLYEIYQDVDRPCPQVLRRAGRAQHDHGPEPKGY